MSSSVDFFRNLTSFFTESDDGDVNKRLPFRVMGKTVLLKYGTLRGLNPGPYAKDKDAKRMRYHCAKCP